MHAEAAFREAKQSWTCGATAEPPSSKESCVVAKAAAISHCKRERGQADKATSRNEMHGTQEVGWSVCVLPYLVVGKKLRSYFKVLATLAQKSLRLVLKFEDSAPNGAGNRSEPSQAVPETSASFSDTCYSMSAPAAGNRS